MKERAYLSKHFGIKIVSAHALSWGGNYDSWEIQFSDNSTEQINNVHIDWRYDGKRAALAEAKELAVFAKLKREQGNLIKDISGEIVGF